MVTMESTLSGVGVKTAGAAPSDPESISVEVSSRRLGMSSQRTRTSAERTLMSVIRHIPVTDRLRIHNLSILRPPAGNEPAFGERACRAEIW
jgi:hypothetical protein